MPRPLPNTPVSLNSSHPLAAGLDAAWTFNVSPPLELIRGLTPTVFAGTPTVGQTSLGFAYESPVANQINAWQFLSGHFLGGLSNFTIVVGVQDSYGAVGQNNGMPLYCERAPTGQDIVKLEISKVGNAPGCVLRDDAGTLINGTGSTHVVTDGVPHALVMLKTPTLVSLYIDGAFDSSATWAGTNTFTEAGTVLLTAGDPADGAATSPQFVNYVWTYSRALSTSEIASLAADPFQFLVFPGGTVPGNMCFALQR